MWEAVADLRFREAEDDAPADILIGAQVEPEGRAFADVFYDAGSAQPHQADLAVSDLLEPGAPLESRVRRRPQDL